MKHDVRLGLLSCLVVVLVGGEPGRAAEDRPPGRPPPLSLEGFMDEHLPDASSAHRVLLAENQACYVCHENYKGEELVQLHAKAKIGCVLCHGESNDHRNDENNTTPPDEMYSQTRVDGMCHRCHYEHPVPPRMVIERWQERCPTKTNPKEIVCTDCHFEHRLALRNVRWDKESGDLLLHGKGLLAKPPAQTGAGR